MLTSTASEASLSASRLESRWEGLPTSQAWLPFEGLASGLDPSWGSVYGCNCIISQSL